MISSAVYRFRAMPPPFADRKLNSRSGLVYYRGHVSGDLVSLVSFVCVVRQAKETRLTREPDTIPGIRLPPICHL